MSKLLKYAKATIIEVHTCYQYLPCCPYFYLFFLKAFGHLYMVTMVYMFFVS